MKWLLNIIVFLIPSIVIIAQLTPNSGGTGNQRNVAQELFSRAKAANSGTYNPLEYQQRRSQSLPPLVSPVPLPNQTNFNTHAVTSHQDLLQLHAKIRRDYEESLRKKAIEAEHMRSLADTSTSPQEFEFPGFHVFPETRYFYNVWGELTAMLDGKTKPMLKRAVYLVENSYNENQDSYIWYLNYIDSCVAFINDALIVNGYDLNDDIAKKMMLHSFISGVMYPSYQPHLV